MRKAHIVPDLDHPNVYRVRWADGSYSDMTNLSRAKDALNVRETIEANAKKKLKLTAIVVEACRA